MQRAAEHPNVFVKVSGLGTCADWEGWRPADMQRYVDWAIEHFGADRLLFGGDWPVSILAGGYARMWAGTQVLLAGLTQEERAQVLGGTAVRVYRLAVDGG